MTRIREQGHGVAGDAVAPFDDNKRKVQGNLIITLTTLAYEALKLEDKVGTMLPCNVIVQELAPGRIEVAAIDPVASMAAIDNPPLLEKAKIVRDKLEKVIQSL